MSAVPFHPGELEAQIHAGGGPGGSGIRSFLLDHQRKFFEALPYVLVASVDRGWPAATILAGPPGFVSAPDPRRLEIAAALDPEDPAQRAIAPGRPIALLGIDLATRRRNRANGIVAGASARGFTLEVEQGFGNCPQYIHVRDFRPLPGEWRGIETLAGVDAEAQEAIARADTFFVGSAARTGVLLRQRVPLRGAGQRGGALVDHQHELFHGVLLEGSVCIGVCLCTSCCRTPSRSCDTRQSSVTISSAAMRSSSPVTSIAAIWYSLWSVNCTTPWI